MICTHMLFQRSLNNVFGQVGLFSNNACDMYFSDIPVQISVRDWQSG